MDNDNQSISTLKDYKVSLETSFKRIDQELKSVKKSSKNKEKILKILQNEIKSIQNNCKSMDRELFILKSEEKKEEWAKTIKELKGRKKKYEKKVDDFETENFGLISDQQNIDHLNLDIRVDPKNLNIQQNMERGDKLVDDMDQRIDNIIREVNEGIKKMKETNIELDGQQQNLDIVKSDLNEIDMSLSRAKNQITNMFKILSEDKIIVCLIVIILIIIITIIIVSACGGDKNKNFNVPHDIFFSSNNSTSTNQGIFISNINLIKNLILLFFIIFFF